MFSLLRDGIISLNRYILYILNRIAHTGQKTTTLRQPMVIVLVAIALVAVVGGYSFVSNYIMPNIHQVARVG